ncbi:unnamed protein product [Onchocerca flexuosa]|uniref:Uncharacterized protein n=1 Tax=Onchocerca flexuosa TaxID=387005 RepID=A0A183HM21_9BILA|nr:unnamed protein product [Onchocerca flexuosa]
MYISDDILHAQICHDSTTLMIPRSPRLVAVRMQRKLCDDSLQIKQRKDGPSTNERTRQRMAQMRSERCISRIADAQLRTY